MRKYKYISILLVLVIVICSSYCTSTRASELAVGGSVLSSGGLALLGLLGLSGLGMELENNRKFNDLSDQEKERIENGLAQNFEEVGLQRGYALEQIKGWVSELQKGVLDKSSEVWDFFKDWAKSIELISSTDGKPVEDGSLLQPSSLLGFTFTNIYGYTITLDSDIINQLGTQNNRVGYMVVSPSNSSGWQFYIVAISNDSNAVIGRDTYCTTYRFSKTGDSYLVSSSTSSGSMLSYLVQSYQQYVKGVWASKPIYILDNSSWQPIGDNINGLGFSEDVSIFSTNTDYLERLKGKNEPIEVIDVTDIKHPIVISQPNTVANIDWNRGMNNNNDDDNKPKGALVPADVWYDHLDDYIEAQNDAIVEYDNAIQENPQDSDKIFISPAPIVNINNYNNTLPVINYPVGGTVVNNYYEYNNINNNNTTIYELPYNTDLIPMLPTLFFENKFPFCIPWDIYNFLAMFYVEKEAPRIDVPFPIKGLTMETETITIDLSPYNYLSDVLRVMFFVLFIVGLAFVTRYLIKG